MDQNPSVQSLSQGCRWLESISSFGKYPLLWKTFPPLYLFVNRRQDLVIGKAKAGGFRKRTVRLALLTDVILHASEFRATPSKDFAWMNWIGEKDRKIRRPSTSRSISCQRYDTIIG